MMQCVSFYETALYGLKRLPKVAPAVGIPAARIRTRFKATNRRQQMNFRPLSRALHAAVLGFVAVVTPSTARWRSPPIRPSRSA
jgi:hypothetical protein